MTATTETKLPNFSNIDISKIPHTLKELLAQNRAELSFLLQQKHFAWKNLMLPLDAMGDRLHQFWALVSHMNAVINSEELRKAYNECLPKLSEYYTAISHNRALYEAIQSLTESKEYEHYDHAQKKVLENELRDFKLAGVALEPDQKKEFANLTKALSELTTKFEENLLDATTDFQRLIRDEKDLSGIPEHALASAKHRAEKAKQVGWLFTLEMPSYLSIIMHADSSKIREEFYRAYVTRASDLGPEAKQWDNSEIMHSILCKRTELAKLLNFTNYAEMSLATKMANAPQQVLDFLQHLSDAAHDRAKQEFETLAEFAKTQLKIENLQPWDITYAAEKLRQHQHNISQEQLRPYFKEENVIKGLFDIVSRLFQIKIKPVKHFDSWHSDVSLFALYDKDGKIFSYCYFDLYARPNKRGGAWMDDCQIRRKLANSKIQLPIAFVTCNFNSPTKDTPALFSHDEVVTLFHEFGHALQHMLTTVNYAEVSGINGIPWDAVELASQFLENWAWQRESLLMFAKHYKTDEPLPAEMFDKLNQAKNFQSAMLMQRQIEFSLFDFLLHMQFNPKEKNQIQNILDQVRKKVSVVPIATFNRFQNGFSHIFAGGYAAGYYCYKWAEVMASDAFSLFLQEGIFDSETANAFLKYIMQPGGSEDPAVLFKKFRGHEPQIDALLEQSGIK